MFKRVLCSAILLGFILACSQEPTGGLDKPPPIQLGTPIGDNDVNRQVTNLLWARDGSEIYYYAADTHHYSALKAVRVEDGSTRTIDPRVRYRLDLTGSRDHRAILDFSADDIHDSSFVVERIAIDGSSVQRLAQDVQYTFHNGWPAAFAEHDGFYVFTRKGADCRLKPDAAHARFSYCDTLFSQNAAAGEPAAIGPGDLIALAPDGSQVLFLAEPCDKVGPLRDCQAMIHRMTDDATFSAGFTERSDDFSLRYRWDRRGLRRLAIHYWDHPLLYIENLVTRDTTLVHRFKGQPGPATYLADIAWSDDDTRLVLWTLDMRLHVIDIGSVPRMIAAVTPDMDPGDIALSPDGKTVAYVVGDRIYLQNIEP